MNTHEKALSLIKENPHLLEQIGQAAQKELERRAIERGRAHFKHFIEFINPSYIFHWHHELLANKLNDFAEGEIKKMMVFIPPQHGKSEQTSRLFPAYMLGKNPNARLIGCSYTAELAKKFNRSIQRLIESDEYAKVFPHTKLAGKGEKDPKDSTKVKSSTLFEIVGHKGSYMNAGVGGGITGNSCDIGIIDDPVKGAEQAASPTLRENQWDWYNAAFLTRLHNDSQVLLIMTRWHQDDLAGRILAGENAHEWEVVSFPAIKENDNDPNDPRQIGDALWPQRHNLQKLLAQKTENGRVFQSLYQQDPRPWVNSLCFPEYMTITDEEFERAQGSVFYGLDLGYGGESPSALVAGKLVGKNYYLKEMIYHSLSIDELANTMLKLGLQREIIICDSANPAFIAELKRRGLVNILPAVKPKIEVRVALMRDNCNIKITKSSRFLIGEISDYHYLEDAKGVATEKIPPRQEDHALDAAGYLFLYLHKQGQRKPTQTGYIDYESIFG